MLHIDLFSGIGGFALATEMVWDNVDHVFCDNDKFCQTILKKHWPDSTIYGEIDELIADTKSKRQLPKDKQKNDTEENRERRRYKFMGENAFLLTGGFPCQPFSQAGRRKGTSDDRYLWPQMAAVIRNTKPTWVIAENVSGLVTWNEGLVFETVCSDLENEGYEVQSFIIPAISKGAPHRRDRVWIVAHHTSQSKGDEEPSRLRETKSEGLRGHTENSWKQDWTQVAAKLCLVDDGLPNKLPRPRGWRNAALKATGNAIVPQVAAEVMRAML